MASAEDKYVYKPLPGDPTGGQMSLRFIMLKPGKDEEDISCSIFHHTFIEKPQYQRGPVQYEALSYTWGPPTPLRYIKLEGKRFPVRENLYWALIHLRLQDEERMIWIDGICINQEDDEEKAVQVAQMRLLYQGATKVTVWLGRENMGLETNALDVIKRICDRETCTREFWKQIYEDLKAEGDSKVPEWVALTTLCGLEYWSRVWIVQEVVLGYKVYLHWGRGSMEWWDFQDVLDRISAMEEDPEFGVSFRQWSETLTGSLPFRLCEQKFGGGKAMAYGVHTAYESLGTYEESGCFDIRDKVFGMVGISRSKIPVNYSSTALEVCGEIMKDAVSVTKANTAPEDLFIMGEYVHKMLCAPEITPQVAFESGQRQNILESPIKVISNISGHTIYLTNTLDTYRSHSQITLQLELMGALDAVHDLPEIKRQLAYLSTIVKEMPDSILKQFQDESLNRAWAIPETTSYASVQGTHPSAAWKVDEDAKKVLDEIEKTSKKAFHEGTFPTPEETLATLILSASTNLPLDSARGLKIFLSSSGLVGFASDTVVTGDQVCTFMKSQTLAIIRPSSKDEEKCNLVCIASNYSRDLDKLATGPMKPVRGGMMQKGNVPDQMIHFHLSLGVLQALCCFNRQAAKFVGYQKNRSEAVKRRLNPYAYRGNF